MGLGKKSKKELIDLVNHLQAQLSNNGRTQSKGASEEDLYKILAHSSQVGFYIMQNRKFQFINSHFREYAGYTEEEMLNMNPTSLVLPEDRRKMAKNAIMMLKEQRFSPYEFRIVTKDGRIKWIIEIVMSITFKGKRALLGNSMDITEQKKTQEDLERSRQELRNLSVHLQSEREKESTRIARKIHDELGQSLTALQMDLSWLKSRLPANNKSIREKTRSMSGLVDSIIESVHKITTELRPSLLDDLGLPAAIEWQAANFQKRSDIRCQAHIHCGNGVIDKELATAIFRIFQEILTNIALHAKATQCKVSLTENKKELCLEVTDNGVGITQRQVDDSQSFGMIGMRERAHFWGGTVHVRNAKPSGTTVRVLIPLGKGERQA